MKFQIDTQFMIDCFRDIVEVPSPVGYDVLLKPVLERYAAQLGQSIIYDRRGTPYIALDGQDNSKTVLLGAHADTLGLMVRHIESNGTLRVRALGGINFNNIEGSTVTVYTRSGRSYTGIGCILLKKVYLGLDLSQVSTDRICCQVECQHRIKTGYIIGHRKVACRLRIGRVGFASVVRM